MTRKIAIALIVLAGCTGSSKRNDDADAALLTTQPAETTETIVGSLVQPVDTGGSSDAETGFFCGAFGNEEPPTLLAIDLETAMPLWHTCAEHPTSPTIIARAIGATIVLEQDGWGRFEAVGIDDTGSERWRRPVRQDNQQLFVSGPTVIVTGAEVEAIDAATGDVQWTHPVADGIPIGTAGELVIEAKGGPYALSTDRPSQPIDGRTNMRAIDAATGTKQRWSREVELASQPLMSQYSATVTTDVVVIPNQNATTSFIDAATGKDLGSETGSGTAHSSLVIIRDPATFAISAIVEPSSGLRLDEPNGEPVWNLASAAPPAHGDRVLLASTQQTGPAAKLWMVDLITGEIAWEVPYRQVIGQSAEHVVTVDQSSLQVLDATDGTLLSEYRAPTELATFMSAVEGDGMLVVAPQWRGGGATGSPPASDVLTPTCAGGTVLLDTAVDEERVVVTESTDGDWFCVTMDGTESLPAPVPSVTTADPRSDSTGFLGSGFPPAAAYYVFVLPEDFPDVTVVDELGESMVVARGRASDYIVVVQPTIGQVAGAPASAQRTVDLVGADGIVLAEVSFSGFSQEGAPTFEEVQACVRDAGVEIPTITPGAATTVATPPSPEALRAAWEDCHELLFAYMRYSQPGRPEYLQDQFAIHDCLAGAGFFQLLGQPIIDQAAYNRSLEGCGDRSPGRAALVQCLRANGLDVVIDGTISGGPHPPAETSAAWTPCRDVAETWLFASGTPTTDVLERWDCMAARGWIPSVMDPTELTGAGVGAARTGCA